MFACLRRRRRRGLIILVLYSLVRKVNKLMADIAALNAAIAALDAEVKAIPAPTPPVALDLQPQVDAVNAIGAELKAKFPPVVPAA